MPKPILYVALIVLVCSCNNTSKNQGGETTKEGIEKKTESGQADAAKSWLVHSVERFFRDYDKLGGNYSGICTKEYAEFKQDATNVDMDGGMTEEAFKDKWGRRFNEFAGIGEGFMVAGTDFGTIKVTACKFKNQTEMGGYLFECILEDTEFKSKFYRDIVVVEAGRSFRIDNVFERKNVFAE